MQSVLDFLYDLSIHNDRDWFNANKNRYVEANNTFNAFAVELARRLGEIDPQIGRQQLKVRGISKERICLLPGIIF